MRREEGRERGGRKEEGRKKITVYFPIASELTIAAPLPPDDLSPAANKFMRLSPCPAGAEKISFPRGCDKSNRRIIF
jgi:hypothetical protein